VAAPRGRPHDVEDRAVVDGCQVDVVEAIRAVTGSGVDFSYYEFDQIDEAARDAVGGTVIKPVLRIR
jgi:hypothetical protein